MHLDNRLGQLSENTDASASIAGNSPRQLDVHVGAISGVHCSVTVCHKNPISHRRAVTLALHISNTSSRKSYWMN